MNKYAIVGFGGAGYHAAKEIRRLDKEAVIDVYSDTDIGPYNPMLTTYFVKGAIPYDAMFPFGDLDAVREALKLNIHANTPVTGLDPERKTLKLADGEARYDKILISTGSSALMPPIPGLDLPGVIKMRTAQDAVRLKDMLDSGTVKSGLVIGASWVGIKVVEDLAARDIPCTLVDGAKWMFYVAAFEETAKRAQKDLEEKGVRVECGQMLSRIQREEDGRLTAVMQSGERFTADVIAACIGVRMNVGFLKDSGLAMNRGVIVDKQMRTSREGIYAAGDCCEAVDIQSGTTATSVFGSTPANRARSPAPTWQVFPRSLTPTCWSIWPTTWATTLSASATSASAKIPTSFTSTRMTGTISGPSSAERTSSASTSSAPATATAPSRISLSRGSKTGQPAWM